MKTPAQKARAVRSSRAWQLRNPAKKRGYDRAYERKKRYRLDQPGFEFLMKLVNGRCPICRSRPATSIDHDHRTKAVRLPLCHQCNTLLGMAGDSVTTLRAAIEYLEFFQ